MTSVDRIQGLSGSLAIKAPVRVATTANITLSGEQTIDGVAVVEDDRVLVKDQTDTTENGIYNASTGTWVRALDFDGANDAKNGTQVLVTSGTAGANLVYRTSGTDPISFGTTALTFPVALSSMAVSAFIATLLDDANAAAALTTLGVSAFAKTLLDDTTAATARATLQLEAVRADIASAATLNLDATTTHSLNVTGTTATTAMTLADGASRVLVAAAAWPITHSASLICPGGVSYTCAAGDIILAIGEPAGVVRLAIWKADGTPVVSSSSAVTTPPAVRQTILSGAVDSSGLPNFGGSTGSTTVTTSTTLKATCAAGGNDNRTGSIVNPSWTGLSTNGTMYLYLDIASDGTVTTGSTTLAPNYQWGGTYSTTNNQNTFNIQEMTMKVGNGASAAQVYRVFAGEVTVAGGVVTAIVWYAPMGRYISADTALPADGTAFSANHNIGVSLMLTPPQCFFICQSADSGYAAGDVLVAGAYAGALSYNSQLTISLTNKVVSCDLGSDLNIQHKTTGANTYPTKSNFKYRFVVQRGW